MVCHETKKYSSILKENSVSKQNLVKSQRYFVNPNTNKLINTELETMNNRIKKNGIKQLLINRRVGDC